LTIAAGRLKNFVISPALKSRLCLAGFIFTVLLKFWLVWEMEIADAVDDPHEYVLQILYPVNGGLAYPPGTGLVGRLFHDLGIPFRLGIEAAFLAASTLVVRSLFRWPWEGWLGLGLFFLTILNPATAELFSHLFSDQVWLIETMLAVSCFVLVFREEGRLGWSFLLLTVFFFGLSEITRSVSIPLLAGTNLFALLALALLLAKHRSKMLKRNLDLLALTIPTLIFGQLLIYGGVCRFNYVHHGYTGLSYIDSTEYKDFYLTLQAVGDPTGGRYFPIDEDRRKLIARAGPDSAWFVGQLEANGFYKQAGLDHYGRYDIPSGWFHWATFSATMNGGDYMTAFAIFHSIEGEIADAGHRGVIKVRSIAPLPDCRINIVMGAFPDGLRHAIRQSLHEPVPTAFTIQGAHSRYDNPEFTRALTRRTVMESPLRESVWRILARVYALIYTRATFYLYAAVLVVFMGAVAVRWKQIEEFSLTFIAQQFFNVLFIVFLLWYAFFDASGMPVTARYMVLNHLLMPLLIAYFASATVRVLRGESRL
jgi:hypothetical protein